MKPVIIGCRTDHFSEEQLATFSTHQPLGMILFAEPFKTGPDAVRHVVAQFKSACPAGLIFIDAEGGTVNRLKPAFGHGWRDIPAARCFGALALRNQDAALRAIYLNAQLIAHDLNGMGITVNCAPVADIVASDVITKTDDDGRPHATSASLYQRSFGHDPVLVAACAKAFITGMASLGLAAVVKHVPGYGRVSADPHYAQTGIETPLDELRQSDFKAFRLLNDAGAMMTGHVVYTAIDPDNCSTMSQAVLTLVREDIGFKGVLIADTIEMNATYPEGFSRTEKDQFGMGLPLPGTLAHVTRRALAAGCDVVMHSDCSRNFADTVDVLEAAPAVTGDRAAWMIKNLSARKSLEDFDAAAAQAELGLILNG